MSTSSLVYIVSLILVIIGVIVGMLGSSGAVRKYLKLWKSYLKYQYFYL